MYCHFLAYRLSGHSSTIAPMRLMCPVTKTEGGAAFRELAFYSGTPCRQRFEPLLSLLTGFNFLEAGIKAHVHIMVDTT